MDWVGEIFQETASDALVSVLFVLQDLIPMV